MTTRRAFLSLFSFLLMPAISLGHENLEPVDDSGAQDMPRRFMMQDVNGTVVTHETVLGKFSLIYFGYIGCPDVCPTSLMTMADVLKKISGRAEKVLAFFVTVDPSRDTAKVLSEYTSNFDSRIIALRGPKEYTDHMVKSFNARYEFHYPDTSDKTKYSVDHTASIALLGPDGTLVKRYPHGLTSDEIANDLAALIDGTPAN